MLGVLTWLRVENRIVLNIHTLNSSALRSGVRLIELYLTSKKIKT